LKLTEHLTLKLNTEWSVHLIACYYFRGPLQTKCVV